MRTNENLAIALTNKIVSECIGSSMGSTFIHNEKIKNLIQLTLDWKDYENDLKNAEKLKRQDADNQPDKDRSGHPGH